MDVAKTLAEWREIGFYPVLPRAGTGSDSKSAEARLEDALLYQFLAAGQARNPTTLALRRRGSVMMFSGGRSSFSTAIVR